MNSFFKEQLAFVVFFLALSLCAFSQQKTAQRYFSMPKGITGNDYLPKTIIVKVKPGYRQFCYADKIAEPLVESILESIEAIELRKIFPHAKPPENTKNERGEKLTDLSLMYEFSYTAGLSEEVVINRLITTKKFEYAELHIIDQLMLTPNDPGLSEDGSYFLGMINAYNAWDLSRGDTNVVIGITDTGIEITHPDLVNSIKYNYADPINNNDDDGDGYTDNFRGWDLGENDNNPQFTASSHGVHVSGLASASVNNGVGMAGVGYKCKFLPIKIANANGVLTKGYEGIVYAADHGCQIINCSWGGSFGTQYGQDIVNYAAINKNALVVGGAGNDSMQTEFYPASFDNVLSIASTNNIDHKSGFSNFGYSIDVCAPGDRVYSTWELLYGGYLTSSGTSMSAPVVCGAAAIVKSYFPSYTGIQVGEVLKATADNIDYTAGNNAWAGKLGKGRINLYRALTETNTKSVVITQAIINDGNDNAFVENDTLNFTGVFTNYLAPLSNLTASITCLSPYVQVLSSGATIGGLNTLASATNSASPFRIRILPIAPQNQDVIMKITMTDGTYTSDQYFVITVNVDYINIAVNDVATTITSRGNVGYNGNTQNEGLGFTYLDGSTMLYDAGLMVGVPAKVSDNVRGDAGSLPDNDYASIWNVHRINPAMASDFDVEGAFNDGPAASDKIPVEVNHKAYAWTADGYRKFVIVEYRIKNTGTDMQDSLYAGIFADWDIMNPNENKASFDAVKRMGYIYSTESQGLWAGIKLLTPGYVTCNSIDNVAGGMGGINMFDGFSNADKYQSLSLQRDDAGGSGTGNDVIHVVSAGPFTLLPDSSVLVAFALIAGDSLADLKASADAAQEKYDVDVPNGIADIVSEDDILLYPNPAGNELNIAFSSLTKTANYKIAITSVSGKVVSVLTAVKPQVTIDISALEAGIYFCHIQSDPGSFYRKFIVVK